MAKYVTMLDMAGREPDVGATSRAVAANVRRLRETQNMTFTEVAERLATLGWSINAVGIRRIENGERRVTPDDLTALAGVLGVSPASLLMPDLATVIEKDQVPVTGWHKPITATAVWRWLTAAAPLVRGTEGSFIDRALPSWERERRLKGLADDGDD